MDLEKFDEITAENLTLPYAKNVSATSIGDELNKEDELDEEVTTGEELLDLAETEDLTDEQKKEIFIEQLKESKIHFRNVVHDGNKTTSKFGADYRKKRQNKNKAQRKARKVSR
jgi:hypothetical protein